jgi:hypothetical protein
MNSFLRTIVALVFFFSITAQAQFGKEWLLCKTDDDCVKINGLCGRKDSINKKFTTDFDKFILKMSAVSSCMALNEKEKKHNENSIAKCLNNQCKLEDVPEKQ